MDCPDTCALEVEVENNRVQKIRGNRDHPNTSGFICSKVAQFHKRIYHKDRLLYPMRRTAAKGKGQFERISWDEALKEIATQFQRVTQEWGGEAILPYHYGGSNGLLGEELLDDFFFARLGASQLHKTLCAAPTTSVYRDMYGKMPGVSFEDYVHSKMILIWGANPKASNIHLVPYIKKAKKNGAFVAVVDPCKNFSTQEIDLHLPVFPGTDLPLALALINEWKKNHCLATEFLKKHTVGLNNLLEASEQWPVDRASKETGIEADHIRLLAERYAEKSPAVMRCGWGVERNQNGGQAVAAILAMPALLGKFGVYGGGFTMSNSGAFKLDKEKVLGRFKWNSRTINMTELGMALTKDLTPPIKSLYVYNCNPAVTAPDQNTVLRGLLREDLFTVVHEQVMTDTAQYADILLPAATFLEQKEIKRAYGSYAVGGVQPAIEVLGEARPNEMVFAALGRFMGWADAPFHWDTDIYMEKVSNSIQVNGRAANPKKFVEGKLEHYGFPESSPIQFKTVFPRTSDGKIHLTPRVLGSSPYKYIPIKMSQYPLTLISPATSKMITSTLGEFNYSELRCTLNPNDASSRNIRAGDAIRIFNDLGEVICNAQVSDKVRPGVVVLPKGAWMKSSKNQRTATALAPSHVNIVGGGACFNDARVEVVKASSGTAT